MQGMAACDALNRCLESLAADYTSVKFCRIRASEARLSINFVRVLVFWLLHISPTLLLYLCYIFIQCRLQSRKFMLLPIVKIAKCFRHVVSLNVNILFLTPTVPVDAQDICRSKSGIHHRPVSAGFSRPIMFTMVQQLLSRE